MFIESPVKDIESGFCKKYIMGQIFTEGLTAKWF